MKKLLMTASAVFLALGTVASAASLTLTGSAANGGALTAGSIPGDPQPTTPNNNVLDQLTGVTGSSMDGFFGATVGVDGETSLLVEFFGGEASFLNQFNMDGNQFSHDGTSGDGSTIAADVNSPLASFTVYVGAAGDLVFNFDTDGGNAASTRPVIANGANPGNVSQNFFASFNGSATATSGNVLWLFFDDAGQPGDNHDDLAVRISVVPLPAGALLLITGIAGFGAMRRRKAA